MKKITKDIFQNEIENRSMGPVKSKFRVYIESLKVGEGLMFDKDDIFPSRPSQALQIIQKSNGTKYTHSHDIRNHILYVMRIK